MEFEPISLVVSITYKGEVIASQVKVTQDELFGLREGAFNLEEQLKGICGKAVKEAFKHELVLENIKAKANA